ncbi:MAG: SGNH/GDSL hydrolase family protein [Clostridia bacterium]|nr:SGNH/GDSL hydrolase family protein [Clostridia bacterium]
MMKKQLYVMRLLCLLLASLFVLASCGGGSQGGATTTQAPATTEAPDVVEEGELTLTWHYGRVFSGEEGDGKRGEIRDGVEFYSYTDIFCIPEAGTTISFLDDDSNSGGDKGYADAATMVLSTWIEKDGQWVFDPYGANYYSSSAPKSDIVTYGKNGGIVYTYTTHQDNEYIRLCYRSGQTATFTPDPFVTVTVEKTGEQGTLSEDLSYLTWLRKSAENSYYPILEGITINAIGDSYIAPSSTMKMWPDLLVDKYFGELNNYGIGGSTVTNYVTNKNPMCDRYTSMKRNSPDIVILEGGRNDYTRLAPIGTINSTDTTTFMGALNVIITGLKEKYPDAMIVCITPWNFPGTNDLGLQYHDFVNAMMQVAEARGVYCINASLPDVMGVDMSNEGFRAAYCLNPNDNSHLNQSGMKLVMPAFEKQLAECYEDFLKTGGPQTAGPETLELKWNYGYVASATHSSTPNQLVPNGGGYSYTDVFCIPRAGTTIVFKDDNTNSNNEVKYASASAYVISSWKEVNGAWVLDTDGANYAGSGTNTSSILTSYENGTVTYTYTTTLDNECLRLCFRSGETSSFKPAAYPTVTAELTLQEGTAMEKLYLEKWIEDSKKNYYNAVLEGLTVNAIGDSYFAGNGLESGHVWIQLLAKKYGQDMNNYGKNGSMVSNYTGTNNPMCLRYGSMANNNPAIVLIEGGKNDYNQGTPLGTVDSHDNKTFMGALNVIIEGVKAKYPNAMIVCITPWNFTNTRSHPLVSVDYANAMKAVAEAQGVYCIYAYDTEISGVDMTNEDFRAKYCMKPSDVSHLNLDGMKIVMPRFEKLLAEFYTDFLAKK